MRYFELRNPYILALMRVFGILRIKREKKKSKLLRYLQKLVNLPLIQIYFCLRFVLLLLSKEENINWEAVACIDCFLQGFGVVS